MPTVANERRRHAKKFFGHGRVTDMMKKNPAALITPKLVGTAEVPRDRYLQFGGIRRRYAAMADSCDRGGRENELTVRLLIMLWARKGVLFGARWEEFDNDVK